MKKPNNINLIVISLFIILSLSFFIYIIKHSSTFFTNFIYTGSKEIYNENHNILPLNVEAKTGDIKFIYNNGDYINITIKGKEKDIVKVNEDNDVINILYSEYSKVRTNLISNSSSQIIISLPRFYNENIEIVMGAGNITSNTVINSKFNIQADVGDIKLVELKNSFLKLSIGDVYIDKVVSSNINTTTGDIKIKDSINSNITTNIGEIKINNVKDFIDAQTTIGDINIEKLNIKKDSKIKTTTGNIKINNINDIYVEGKTTAGDVKIDYSNRSAKNELILKATTGDIKVIKQ